MFVKEKCFYIGQIVRTHGIHGQLVLASEVQFSDKILEEPFLVEFDGGLVPFYLDKENGLKSRDHQSYLIKFDHITSKEQAEEYTHCEVFLETLLTQKSEELPEETSLLKNYSIYDVNDKFVGTVSDVLDFSGNTLVQLFIDSEEVLLPFTEEHIIEWNNEMRKITLDIPEGLLDL